jgi:hypothetical protein
MGFKNMKTNFTFTDMKPLHNSLIDFAMIFNKKLFNILILIDNITILW